MDPIVIVGSGFAGYSLARNLRRLDKSVRITLVSANQGEFYSKPMLSEALSAGQSASMLINKSADQMAAQLNVDVRTNALVSAIDGGRHEIEIGDRRTPSASQRLPYAKLVLAAGAAAIHVPIAGDAARHVLSVNGLDDYTRFRAALLPAARVLILGAGLIGCEFANDLVGAGYRVDVIDPSTQPLGRWLPPAGAAMLGRSLANAGVNWHLATSAQRVDRHGAAYRVSLDNGKTVDADVVLSAVGLRPRTSLAMGAGLQVARGIVVDRLLQTSAPDIYALGDCAEVEGLVLPFIAPITHAARALALTLTGKPSPLRYPAMPIVVKTPACPTVVASPPAGVQGGWEVTESADGVTSMYLDSAGNLHGYALNGKDVRDSQALLNLLPAWLG